VGRYVSAKHHAGSLRANLRCRKNAGRVASFPSPSEWAARRFDHLARDAEERDGEHVSAVDQIVQARTSLASPSDVDVQLSFDGTAG
jgi:hypothetical protein